MNTAENNENNSLRLARQVVQEWAEVEALLWLYALGEVDDHQRAEAEGVLQDSEEAAAMYRDIQAEVAAGAGAAQAPPARGATWPALLADLPERVAREVVAVVRRLADNYLEIVALPMPGVESIGYAAPDSLAEDQAVGPTRVSIMLTNPEMSVEVKPAQGEPPTFMLTIRVPPGGDDRVRLELRQEGGGGGGRADDFIPIGPSRPLDGRPIERCPPGVVRIILLPSERAAVVRLLADPPHAG